MTKFVRITLLFLACFIGGAFALRGITFTFAVEPKSSQLSVVIWMLIGVAFSLPIWLPAIFPARLRRTHTFVRRVSAILLCFPTILFAGTVINQLGRLHQHLEGTTASLIQASLLTAACLLAFALIIRSDVWGLTTWLRNRT